MEEILGKTYAIFALCIVCGALPVQLLRNHKEKDCGLVFPLIFLTLGVYITRTGAMFLEKRWYIFFPDLVGSTMTIIWMVQYFKYNWPRTWNKIKNCNWRDCMEKYLSLAADSVKTIRGKR